MDQEEEVAGREHQKDDESAFQVSAQEIGRSRSPASVGHASPGGLEPGPDPGVFAPVTLVRDIVGRKKVGRGGGWWWCVLVACIGDDGPGRRWRTRPPDIGTDGTIIKASGPNLPLSDGRCRR